MISFCKLINLRRAFHFVHFTHCSEVDFASFLTFLFFRFCFLTLDLIFSPEECNTRQGSLLNVNNLMLMMLMIGVMVAVMHNPLHRPLLSFFWHCPIVQFIISTTTLSVCLCAIVIITCAHSTVLCVHPTCTCTFSLFASPASVLLLINNLLASESATATATTTVLFYFVCARPMLNYKVSCLISCRHLICHHRRCHCFCCCCTSADLQCRF